MYGVKFLDPLRGKFASPRRDHGSRGFYGSVFKPKEMAKNAFGFHKQRFLITLLPFVGRETESRTQSPIHRAGFTCRWRNNQPPHGEVRRLIVKCYRFRDCWPLAARVVYSRRCVTLFLMAVRIATGLYSSSGCHSRDYHSSLRRGKGPVAAVHGADTVSSHNSEMIGSVPS